MLSRRSVFALPALAAASPSPRTRNWTPLLELSTTPGAAVARIERGRLAWAEYIGVRKSGEPDAIDAGTRFAAASLTKPATACLALQLTDAKTLDLDRPLHHYLPFADNDRARRVTARHVLSHSTGFPNWRNEQGQKLECEFEPGTQFGYSGEGYYLLSQVLEKLAGQSYSSLMQERVFKPLGMAASTVDELKPEASDRATPHTRRGKPRPHFSPPAPSPGKEVLPNNRIPNAAASLWTTIPDYVRFLTHAFERADWFEPRTRINPALSWGMGWGLERHAGSLWCWHWGDNPGFKNIVLCRPGRRDGLLVFTNGDNGRALYEAIARQVLGDGHPAFLWI